jgi:lipopolysaccharide/colanic/teichoic acid biosynthesis glycosyltransferase
MKRLFDFFGALILLLLLTIPMVIVEFLIIIDSGFPIFFTQERVGRYGKPFKIYKFRTMKVHASLSGEFNAGDTSRVTRIGHFLRKTKLDELPQLYNVLRGNMSFVGPRPEVRQWVDFYGSRWQNVLMVKPGITDNASIEFRSRVKNPEKYYANVVLPRKLDFYEKYAKQHSFMDDTTILLHTLLRVVFS